MIRPPPRSTLFPYTPLSRSPEAAAGPRTLRIDPPAGLFVPRVFQLGGQPVLHILRLDDADGAQLAGRHHLARLTHHRVARVIVRDAEDEPGAPYRLHEVERVLDRRGHRLVADHVDAPVEKGAGDGVMTVVRRDDADDLDAVGPLRLGSRPLAEARVDAVRCATKFGARALGD